MGPVVAFLVMAIANGIRGADGLVPCTSSWSPSPEMRATDVPQSRSDGMHLSRRSWLVTTGLCGAAPSIVGATGSTSSPDLTGRIALVTGGNRGLGLATAMDLASNGATVVIGCRDAAKGEEALRKIRASSGRDDCACLPLDLASLSSVRKCADLFISRYQDLHILVNSAGVALPETSPAATTNDGFELQMGVNYLGHFALTGSLLTRLRRAPGGARVVMVADAAHRDAPRLDVTRDLTGPRSEFSQSVAYAKSQLASAIFSAEMQRRLSASGVLATSGGSCGNTGFGDVVTAAIQPSAAPSKFRSDGLVLLASRPVVSPRGAFFDGAGRLLPAYSPFVDDVDLARDLWTASEKATGTKFALQPALENRHARGDSPTAAKLQPNGEVDVEYFKGTTPPDTHLHAHTYTRMSQPSRPYGMDS